MGIESISVKLTGQSHTCIICHSRLKKNGTTSKGTQRWRCITCNASTVFKREDTTARNQLTGFVTWLMSKHSQAEFGGGTGRTFRHQTAWCWNVHPYLHHTGEVFDEIQVDGIYLRQGWCLLIAIAHGRVIGWQWCDREKAEAWTVLVQHFPEPKVVVTDGGSGLMKALKEFWPNVKIQRCLVHIQRNVRTYLTLNPRLPAGKSLRRLSLKLTKIRTQEAAAEWIAAFAAWHAENHELINERTYAADWSGAWPRGLRRNRKWWYTHDRLRSAYESMNKALRRGHLFTYLDKDLNGLGINATTNMIEGAVNSGIRAMIFYHRGMPIEHRRRACEWFCWTHADEGNRPALRTLLRPEHYTPEAKKKAQHMVDEAPIGPELYGTGPSAEDGQFIRSGWMRNIY